MLIAQNISEAQFSNSKNFCSSVMEQALFSGIWNTNGFATSFYFVRYFSVSLQNYTVFYTDIFNVFVSVTARSYNIVLYLQ